MELNMLQYADVMLCGIIFGRLGCVLVIWHQGETIATFCISAESYKGSPSRKVPATADLETYLESAGVSRGT